MFVFAFVWGKVGQFSQKSRNSLFGLDLHFHVSYFNEAYIFSFSILRQNQKVTFCSNQPNIMWLMTKNVEAIYRKIEEFRGRPRESFLCGYLNASQLLKMIWYDQETCQEQYAFWILSISSLFTKLLKKTHTKARARENP